MSHVNPRALVCLCLFLVAALCLPPPRAHAQRRNHYGDQGRSILTTGVLAYASSVEEPDFFGHYYSYATGARLTLLHFVVDDFAVGGTLLGDHYLRDGSTGDRASVSDVGADVDAVLHVPLQRRLSLRFWGFGGVRSQRVRFSQRREQAVTVTGAFDVGGPLEEDYDKRTVRVLTGFSPHLLFHVSSSVALVFGPDLTLSFPVSGGGEWDWDLRVGPSLSYSFGPEDEPPHARFEDANFFASRGRTVLTGLVSIGESVSSSLGFARFVAHHYAIGAYLSSSSSAPFAPRDNLSSAGGGFLGIIDFAVAPSLSVLSLPRLGYMWKSDKSGRAHPFTETVHEIQLELPVLLAMHLNEALVLGVGPQLVSHRRVASTDESLVNERYLQGGLASALLGSF